jgi:hypothetical protein
MKYGIPGFLAVVRFGDLAPPPPLHVVSLPQSSYFSPVEVAGGRGEGGGVENQNHTTARKPFLL